MDIYVKSYRNRIGGILISLLSVLVAVLVSSLLFGNKVNRISSQLKSYSTSDYNYIYKLNYPLGVDDEYIYVDTNIFLYIDSNLNDRVPASVLMQNEDSQYTESFLGHSKILLPNEIVLSENIAEKYNISIGDHIYGLYPYTSEAADLVVVAISATNYDFERPDVDNEIGIVIIGYNDVYSLNFENKTICFSDVSLSSSVSEHPQILDSIFSKSTNCENVFNQGLYIFIIEAMMIVGALFASELFFYRSSFPIIRRLFIKGLPRVYLKRIPEVEHVIFSLTPMVVGISLRMIYIPANSEFVYRLFAMDLLIAIVYCYIFGVRPFKKTNFRVR